METEIVDVILQKNGINNHAITSWLDRIVYKCMEDKKRKTNMHYNIMVRLHGSKHCDVSYLCAKVKIGGIVTPCKGNK